MKILSLRKRYLVLFVVIFSLIIWSLFFRTQSELIEYVTVQRQDLKTEVSTSGVLTGKIALNLRFKSAGKLSKVDIKTGDKVFAGQVLAELNTVDLSVSLKQAKNNLRDKQTTSEKVLDDIHLFQYGEGGFSNIGSLNETMSQRQLRTTVEVARDNAADNVKLVERAFEDSLIISPISGIVTQADFIPGQIVTSADIIARVVDFSEAIFEADVDESDIGDIQTGQRAEVTLNAYGEKQFIGEVTEIIPRTKSVSSGATVITVRIKLTDQSILKIDGLNGQVNIITSQKNGALTIPLEAIKEENTVMVRSGKNFKTVQVKLGERNQTDIEVLEGLNENNQIVKNPSFLK